MKRIYFLTMLGMAFISCDQNEQSTESNSVAKEEIKILEFPSEQKMEQRIDEIVAIKAESQKIALDNFNKLETLKGLNVGSSKTNDVGIEKQNEAIVSSLKVYHGLVLSNIYALRKQLNFTSIQSIADEINSLKLIDPDKATSLFKTYEKLLVTDPKIGRVISVFDERTSNVLNVNGDMLINSKKLDYKNYYYIPNNSTGKLVGYDNGVAGIVVNYNGVQIYYYAGREVHTNDLGVRFFRYATQLTSMALVPIGPGVSSTIEYPSTFIMDPSSVAGFVQTKSQFFSDYEFSYPFISGTGTFVRFVGGNKNTPYRPGGVIIKGTFITNVGGVSKETSCDFKQYYD
ncbi:hypothetical protein DOS84_02380 [Flavobacterium aquariorum]|uniref:Uncharacterized protein n=1 Tax=Flavobacterium aquariorum TaxID=2217670 RepID=A0A2W7VTG2_9FLAO|nr:hypothetical protein [Flavobacterium aquariorum]PZX95432.1 hypothetical protein DOS84_02380 [Flavobacterium aquariorum]